MSTRLLALEGGPDIVVDEDLIVVGRRPECDVRLGSMRVSGIHCCLIEVDGAVLVRDLGSTNGVRINGRRAESGRLRPGDELSIAGFGTASPQPGAPGGELGGCSGPRPLAPPRR